MAGSVLGKDQIDKVNRLYLDIYSLISDLIGNAKTPFDFMKVHFLLDCHETPELFKIFNQLPFLSPAEKKALVRAAIFDVALGKKPEVIDAPLTDNAGVEIKPQTEVLKAYTPPAFKLNVATIMGHQEA